MNILTDDEILSIKEGGSGNWEDDLLYARAIEAAIMERFENVAMVVPPMYGTLSNEISRHLPAFTHLYALKEKK